MEVFGIVGMSFGIMGFVFGIICMKRMDTLAEILKRKGILEPGFKFE